MFSLSIDNDNVRSLICNRETRKKKVPKYHRKDQEILLKYWTNVNHTLM